ncbi:MAG: hypothetical protein COA82_02935 [Alkaliphilus sp.]|nr:hypothetical protein [Alkaliphilus sp. AH-315-G20]PHS35989.1 MAG: hypothetical protein COA82_02935 [Alkaliphilus sp.]
MIIESGYMYFISDEFFKKINDPCLKINYKNTKRPHYYVIKDNKTSLYWVVPCSSKVDKFQAIINKKEALNKSANAIKIINIQGKKTALLFQDMFPISEKYFFEQYIRGGQPVFIANPKQVELLQKNAKKIIKMIHRDVKFTPTQPNANLIERVMLNELQIEIAKEEAAPTTDPTTE